MGLLTSIIRLVWFVTVGWVLGLAAYFGGMLLSIIPLGGVAGRQIARKSWDIATLGI